MDILNWILAVILIGLAVLQFMEIRQVGKQIAYHQSNLNDLVFRHNEASEFMENQIAKIHYQMLVRTGKLKFNADTTLDETLSHPGAHETLVKCKLIKKKDNENSKDTLAQRAAKLDIPLEPVLAALNILETYP